MSRNVEKKAGSKVEEAVDIQHELLLQAWECAFLGSSAVYLSGPITTGPRFVEWYRRVGRAMTPTSLEYANALRKDVIDANGRDLREMAIQLRAELHEPVLEPGSLIMPKWGQNEYLLLWSRVIERFIGRIMLMPGWEYSAGCAAELYRAFLHDLPASSIDGVPLTLSHAVELIRNAVEEISKDAVPVSNLRLFADRMATLLDEQRHPSVSVSNGESVRKDASLDQLAELINVAQFVSFSPARTGLKQEYCRVMGAQPNNLFKSVRHALGTLLERSPEHSINIRSYTPENPRSREFIYGIKVLDDAVSAAERLGSEGLFIIANETVDIHDGGVSGVIMGDVMEFSPDDTPRAVEKPGVASLPRVWGLGLLSIVYGFSPDINVPRRSRLEFSIHPKPRGWRNGHTLGWEYEVTEATGLVANISWPNRFSKMIGDKVYGLLVAHFVGLPVPHTLVFSRRIAPFAFGRRTGTSEVWVRTSPHEQVPGKFTTTKGWIDPFQLMSREDAEGKQIASILAQSAIPSVYAGAAILTGDGHLVVEGKAGEGDTFMKGASRPEELPKEVLRSVESTYNRACVLLGPVRFEWVFDGDTVWVVQLHRGATMTTASVVVPGEAANWVEFDVERGLEQLRETISSLDSGAGLVLRGEVGLTSHVADVVRRAGVPTKLRNVGG
jgi:hypothetical protein